MKMVRLSEMKDDLSKYLRLAETDEIVITRHGKPAGVLIGFGSENDWFEYRLINLTVVVECRTLKPVHAQSGDRSKEKGSFAVSHRVFARMRRSPASHDSERSCDRFGRRRSAIGASADSGDSESKAHAAESGCTWELRVGDLRVYYDVSDSPDPVVLVLAVGVKVHNIVRIGGSSFSP